MKSYAEKLRDPRWQKKRLEIFERDKFKCVDCGDSKSTLNVHHCSYKEDPFSKKISDPWDIYEELLLTVCDSCHESRGYLEKQAKATLEHILAGCRGGDLENLTSGLIEMATVDWESTKFLIELGKKRFKDFELYSKK